MAGPPGEGNVASWIVYPSNARREQNRFIVMKGVATESLESTQLSRLASAAARHEETVMKRVPHSQYTGMSKL
jgi:hypothetical protein